VLNIRKMVRKTELKNRSISF